MAIETGKVRCDDYMCNWIGRQLELIECNLVSSDPRFRGDDKIMVCPECQNPTNGWLSVCDEPGCKEPISCGTLTPEGYRSTCGKHRPKEAGS